VRKQQTQRKENAKGEVQARGLGQGLVKDRARLEKDPSKRRHGQGRRQQSQKHPGIAPSTDPKQEWDSKGQGD
jgi:hypothetical protein